MLLANGLAFNTHVAHRGRINKVALRHYIDFFDFSGLRLDVAFRSVSCDHRKL